jgi:hypothetical protein
MTAKPNAFHVLRDHFDHVVAAAILVAALTYVLAPTFGDLSLAGFHDWDSAAAYRYITVLSLKRFGQFPFWHPYLCGGFPAWAYGEGAPNVVSPFFPAYLLLPMLVALRVEIVGCALLSLAGGYWLAGQHTRSPALRALFAGIYTFNGRWALQVTAGHSWYLAYAFVPWILWAYEEALRGKVTRIVWAGALFALIVYAGGIYPLPHAALLLLLYMLARTMTLRSWRPFVYFAGIGLLGAGLAAPKLLAVMDLMTRFARKIDSTEAIGLEAAVQMLIAPQQTFHIGAAQVPAYGWHEWGMYIGWPALALIVFGVYFARRGAESYLKWIGVIFWVLSLGAFSPYAPWTLLHKLPVFASQHVPSRFMAMAVLASLLASLAWLERTLGHRLRTRITWRVGALAVVGLVLADVANVSRNTTVSAFTLQMPKVAWRAEYKQLQALPYDYSPAGAWAGPSYPAMLANDGFVGCYSVPDRADPKGAIASDQAGYRGESYVVGTSGARAAITSWSPNRVVVSYEGAAAGDWVVLNQNFDPGWRANEAPAASHDRAVAFKAEGATGTVTFSYRPRTWWPSLLVFAVTLAGCVAWVRRRQAWVRRRRDG